MSLLDTSAILQVNNLSVQYPKVDKIAVNNISFNVYPGEVLGILGGNGAGKSTTLKAIAGVIPTFAKSRIIIDNYEITSLATKEAARKLIGYCPDTGGLIRQATVSDHVELLRSNKPSIEKDLAYNIVSRLGLSEHLNKEAGSFSHGMSRRLAVALAVLNSERLLILDEPFDGVDPIGVEVIQEIIQQAKESRLAVIISTHLLNLLVSSSDKVAIMNNGRIIFEESSTYFKSLDASEKYASILKSDMRN